MQSSFKEKLGSYFSNIWFLWGICIVLNIITFLFIYFKIHPGNKTLALHYNVLIGVEWYGKGKNLYYLPGVGLAISVVNFILFREFRKSGEFLASLTVFTSLCVQLIILTATLFLAQVN